ncbi:MAG TPA: 3-hydroxyacyl-ACP dehydratase FabZ [Candidatus Aminicenantes bacterium]|nr:3-hydroxyacyl-ACP dehydratase FabZ [Candidatus Aminicenantes bacterium]
MAAHLIRIEKIQRFLPHRYPFLLVDRILEIQPGKSIRALKNVTVNEPFFQGHFPEIKLMPGVLIVEAVAQAGGILVYHSIKDPHTKFFVLSKIDNVKFRRPAVPGDQLMMTAEIVKLKDKYCLLKGQASVDGEIVAEGEIIASLLYRQELDQRD